MKFRYFPGNRKLKQTESKKPRKIQCTSVYFILIFLFKISFQAIRSNRIRVVIRSFSFRFLPDWFVVIVSFVPHYLLRGRNPIKAKGPTESASDQRRRDVLHGLIRDNIHHWERDVLGVGNQLSQKRFQPMTVRFHVAVQEE